MTNDRYQHLDRTGEALTREERAEGWHYCYEFDQLLTQGEQIDDEGRCAFCGFDGRKFK